ncbi:hypothetical protein HA466_0224550 [Hirschfeldia incana]|nr:hypothetical protein HA466_0224550 [Hirschfeldia incana]
MAPKKGVKVVTKKKTVHFCTVAAIRNPRALICFMRYDQVWNKFFLRMDRVMQGLLIDKEKNNSPVSQGKVQSGS